MNYAYGPNKYERIKESNNSRHIILSNMHGYTRKLCVEHKKFIHLVTALFVSHYHYFLIYLSFSREKETPKLVDNEQKRRYNKENYECKPKHECHQANIRCKYFFLYSTFLRFSTRKKRFLLFTFNLYK